MIVVLAAALSTLFSFCCNDDSPSPPIQTTRVLVSLAHCGVVSLFSSCRASSSWRWNSLRGRGGRVRADMMTPRLLSFTTKKLCHDHATRKCQPTSRRADHATAVLWCTCFFVVLLFLLHDFASYYRSQRSSLTAAHSRTSWQILNHRSPITKPSSLNPEAFNGKSQHNSV